MHLPDSDLESSTDSRNKLYSKNGDFLFCTDPCLPEDLPSDLRVSSQMPLNLFKGEKGYSDDYFRKTNDLPKLFRITVVRLVDMSAGGWIERMN